MKNAINRREFSEFIQKIVRSTKNVGFTKTRIQFDIVYNAIELELRDFSRPDDAAVFNSYFFNMDDFHFWWVFINKYKFNIGGNNQTTKLRIQFENKL